MTAPSRPERGGAAPITTCARYKSDLEGGGVDSAYYPDPDSMRTSGSILAVFCALAVAMAKPGIDQQIAQLEGSNSKLLQYPTQFTQGIMPKMIHSHNDCECARRDDVL